MIPSRPYRTRLLVAVVALLAALGLSMVAGQPSNEDTSPKDETDIIQLRVWQSLTDPEELWLSARPAGGRWDELGTVRLPQGVVVGPYRSPLVEYPLTYQTDHVTVSYGAPGTPPGLHRLIGIKILDHATLRIWQRVSDPRLISVQVPNPGHEGLGWGAWGILGLVPLPLDDGFSPRRHFRYGNLAIAVAANPGLRADREHLLALRDVLAGDGAELDWSASRLAREWEGITLGDAPPRVVGLNLSNHGLNGEIWGWLGELEELTELRLDGNGLTGMIPSKLTLLSKLKLLRLEANKLTGCVPPALREVEDHDLDALELPGCRAPKQLDWSGKTGWSNLPSGTYWLESRTYPLSEEGHQYYVAFDVPPSRSVSISPSNLSPSVLNERDQEDIHSVWDARYGIALHDADNNNVWVFLDDLYATEWERSHYSTCANAWAGGRSPIAFIERIVASAWGFEFPIGERNSWP